MLYLIKSALLIEESNDILDNDKYCSVFKVGYAKEINSRYTSYRTENVSCKLIRSREGGKSEEYMLHLILRGLGLNIDKGREWYKLDPKVIEIFDKPIDELKKMLWENRGDYFPEGIFQPRGRRPAINNHFRSLGHELFTLLYEEFVPESERDSFGSEIYLTGDNQVVRQKTPKVDYFFRRYLETINRKKRDTIPEDIPGSIEQTEFLYRFRAANRFNEKLKMYCEFGDTYPDQLDSVDFKLNEPKFRKYYNYYGTSGCKSRNYLEKNLIDGWKDEDSEDDLKELIFSRFEVGGRYTMKYIKNTLKDFYCRLDISKTPKATDLEKYFKLSKTRVTMPDKSVKDGYKLSEKE